MPKQGNNSDHKIFLFIKKIRLLFEKKIDQILITRSKSKYY